MNKLHSSILVLSLLLITACTVGPNYRTPKTNVPTEFANSRSNAAAPETISHWWTTLQDPTLNSLMDRAVQTNLDLKLAHARVREARALRGIEHADLFPSVNASASYSRLRTSETTAPSQDGNSSGFPNFEGDLYQAGFDAFWEIDVFGGIRRRVEAANAEIGVSVEDRRQILVTTLAEVGRNYVELRAFQTRMAIARENLRSQQETMELTQVRVNAGLSSELDLVRAEAQVQTTASLIPELESSAKRSIHLLSVLLGMEPNALVAELSNESGIPPVPGEVPPGLPSDLLRRRPDIRRAERQLAAATARIGVATADLFPRFSLTSGIGLQSGSLGNITDTGSSYWSIIPGVSLPIFNFGKIRSNIAVQNAREEQAFISYEQTVLTSLREVEDALVSFTENQKRREKLRNAVDANRKAVQLADQLYTTGLTDFLTVLQAQRDLFVTEDAFARIERDVSADYIALYKALGGGWEIETEMKDQPVASPAGERILSVKSN